MRILNKTNAPLFLFVLIGMLAGITCTSFSQISQATPLSDPAIASGAGMDGPVARYPLKFPWAGGLNSCQFCAIDLNSDGIKDLLIFDRHGNRKLTFINHGTPNSVDYSFEPDHAMQLPDLHDWVITADYNNDGKADIFTYNNGGVRVFRNISDTALKFTLVTNLLESFYYSGKVGVLVTSLDYPAFADIDLDGDLDLLTFFGLGSYVEYHKNLSMEKYGNSDSLDFRLTDPCWGKFKESEGGNRITLNANCPTEELQSTRYKARSTKERHTGSTLLALDLNNDGLKDLILGDYDYPGLIALFNGGTVDSAIMVAQDTVFPATSVPVHLFSFPAASLIDIDNDGLDDLLISPFDPALYTSENYNCVWWYKNSGSNSSPTFEKQPEQLFRNEMMDYGSASHPVLYDFDLDGLQDLIVGNGGFYTGSYYQEGLLHSVFTSQVAYYKNTGSPQDPIFQYVTDNLAGISLLELQGAFPAPGDYNGDGLPDLLVGSSDGTLVLFTRTGSVSGLPAFNSPVMNWQGIDVGNYSTPQLFDLDKDQISDLIIGEQDGNINHYNNSGTAEYPVFTMVTDSLGKINVTNYAVSYYGYSVPCFSRQPDGTTFLLCGSDEGLIHLFTNIDNNLEGEFNSTGGLFEWLSTTPNDTLFGWQTSPSLGHLSDPTDFDLVTGNFSGGLNYISKRDEAVIIPGIPSIDKGYIPEVTAFPNPADQEVTIACQAGHGSDNESRIIIFNCLGQKVIEQPYLGPTKISTSAMAPGAYLLRLGRATAKLIILHP